MTGSGFQLFAFTETFLRWIKKYVSVLDKIASLVFELGKILLEEGKTSLDVGLDSGGFRDLTIEGLVVHG